MSDVYCNKCQRFIEHEAECGESHRKHWVCLDDVLAGFK